MSEEKVLTRLDPDERLMSIDALRGFDMFWIVGAHGIVVGLKKLGDYGVIKTVSEQLEHKNWEGIAFEDLIFPLFVFLAGVSMVFSLGKSLEQNGRWKTIGKLGLRAALLFVLGIYYNGGLKKSWPDIRLMGVLQRIALSYFFAGLAFCYFQLPGRIAVFLSLLIGYWALLTFIPVPAGDGAVSRRKPVAGQPPFPQRFDEGTNLANYIDRHYLPGSRYDWKSKEVPTGDHDPEGILSTLPAIATCLLGVLAGMLLKDPDSGQKSKALLLFGGGATCILLGYAWGIQFPVIKKIWTSSYVLVAGGWSLILLSIFYFLIDVLKWRKWALPFVCIGTNALAIYLTTPFIDYGRMASGLVGGNIAAMLGNFAPLVSALVAMGLLLLFANFLYRRKIFIRL